jgi:hypothetical protein
MPSVIVFVRGSELGVNPCYEDSLCIKGMIKKVSFVTVDNGRSDYEVSEPLKYTLTLHGNQKYLEYVNKEFVVAVGNIDWFELESEKGTIYKRYRLEDPVIMLYNLEDSD